MDKRKIISDVAKVWGSEEWIANKDYCGKILNLKKGFQCSIHFHKNKTETFYILSGKVLMVLGDLDKQKEILMLPQDIIDIEKTLKHRFIGLKKSKILEFSTHHEKDDSYRDEGFLSGKVPKNKFEEYSKIYGR